MRSSQSGCHDVRLSGTEGAIIDLRTFWWHHLAPSPFSFFNTSLSSSSFLFKFHSSLSPLFLTHYLSHPSTNQLPIATGISPKMTLPETQWAQVVEKKGGPPIYKQIPVPKPGPDEVLVNIKYSGVCHTDLHAMKGDWPLPLKMPLVGGHEGAGIVVAKGDMASGIEIGDHAGIKWLNGSCLACEFCKTADEPLCAEQKLSGYTVDGTFQQYAIGKAAHVIKLPKDVAFDAIAPILCAGITVYKGLKESGARPGQTVAIVGAGGGLGSLAQQYAKAMGLRVIAIDGGDEKRAMCEQLGSEVRHSINHGFTYVLV